MGNPGPPWPHWSVAEFLGTGQLLDNSVGYLSVWFRLTVPDGAPLPTDLRKGGVLYMFLGCLVAEAVPVLGLTELTPLGINQDGGAHILHPLLSVPVGPYDPYRRLFRCREELPPEVLPAITNIPVDFFRARRAVSAVSWDDHQVHMKGVPPSG